MECESNLLSVDPPVIKRVSQTIKWKKKTGTNERNTLDHMGNYPDFLTIFPNALWCSRSRYLFFHCLILFFHLIIRVLESVLMNREKASFSHNSKSKIISTIICDWCFCPEKWLSQSMTRSKSRRRAEFEKHNNQGDQQVDYLPPSIYK